MANASKWNARLGRLASMDHHELLDRLRQYLTARADALRYGCGRNFAGNSQVGPAGPEGRFFFGPTEVPSLCALLKQVLPSQADDIVFRAEKICRHQFDLLGYENLDFGAKIDWQCDVVHGKRGPRRPWFKVKYLDFEEVGDSKITWELNRHQHFVTLAKAYWLTGDDRFAEGDFRAVDALAKRESLSHWNELGEQPGGCLTAVCPGFGPSSYCRSARFSRLSCANSGRCSEPEWTPYRNLSFDVFFSEYTPSGRGAGFVLFGDSFPELGPAKQWQRCGWKILWKGRPERRSTGRRLLL